MNIHTLRWTVRASFMVMVAALSAALLNSPSAQAYATDEYPIPSKQIETQCDAEQYLAAARDTSPIYFERYMLDKSNRPLDVQQMAVDRIHWFYSLDAAGRRQYSEDTATNIYYEQVATRWGNWAKVFFNNKGVVAKAAAVCMNYPRGDMSVWAWPVAR